VEALSYLTDGCNIADSTAIATTIGNFLLGAKSRVASPRAGSYLIAIPVSFFQMWMAGCNYVFVVLLWLVPDRRIKRVLVKREKSP
jgi:hypothetical protein